MIDLRLDVPFHPALAFELTTKGGATDFALVIAACESFGPYCLIRGLGVNCYVEPVYTLDADIVAVAENLAELSHHLRGEGFVLETFQNSVNARRAGRELRIQFI